MRGVVLAALLAMACSAERAPVSGCLEAAPTRGDGLFADDASGSGSFGRWVIDEDGLPAYAYTLDQRADARALYPVSDERERRDHWHLVGNQRLTATASNEGQVLVYAQDRGLELLNRVHPKSKNFGGGWSILRVDGGEPWASTFAERPPDAEAQRLFGLGWARTAVCRAEIAVRHHLHAPPGDAPFVVDTVRLENRTDRPLGVLHHEVWDVNRHYLVEQLLRSGAINLFLPEEGDRQRDELNEKYRLSALSDAHHARLRHRLADGGTPDARAPANENLYPPDVFLVDLDGPGSRFYTDGRAYWGPPDGEGGPRRPPLPAEAALAPTAATGEPGVLVAERAVEIPAGGAVELRYAFGFVSSLGPDGAPLPDEAAAPLPDFAATAPALLGEATRARLVRLDLGDPALDREMAWHAHTLRSLGGRQDAFGGLHVVNQGSAYWYLHGLDGAVRDFIFSAVALSYIDPPLARDLLRYAARMRFGDSGALAYATAGFGQLSTGGIHERPSDLELFLWWGLGEYVFATGDSSILDENEPFWPPAAHPPRPLHAHLRAGARFLVDQIGIGPHGLIRLSDGDWDDSITFFAKDREAAARDGESVANTAMATVVLPYAAALLDGRDDTTAAELRQLAVQQRAALAGEWSEGSSWYRRAWFGPGEPFGDDVLFLLPNAFALAGDNPAPAEAARLVGQIDAHLAAPSTTGMIQFWYKVKPPTQMAGVTDEGASNPAITGLGVWGLLHADPARALAAFRATTMTRKATVYPDVWYGIWSGPDAQYTNVHAQAGQTWASIATPMTDYPVFNSNQHAGVLLAMLRALGIEPAVVDAPAPGGGTRPRGALRLWPRAPLGRPYAVDLPLFRLSVDGLSARLVYRPERDGEVVLALRPPGDAATLATVAVDGVAQAAGGAEQALPLVVQRGREVVVSWTGR